MIIRVYCLILIGVFSLQIPTSAQEQGGNLSNGYYSPQMLELIDDLTGKIEVDAQEESLHSLSRLLSKNRYMFGSLDIELRRKIRALERHNPREGALLRSSSIHQRIREELGKERVDRLISLLLPLAEHENPTVTLHAYTILLERLFVNDAEAHLEPLLNSSHLITKGFAMVLLGRKCNPKSIPELLEFLEAANSAEQAFTAAPLLLQMGKRDGVWALKELALTEGKNQTDALECLVTYGNQEDLDFLINALAGGKLEGNVALYCFDVLADQAARTEESEPFAKIKKTFSDEQRDDIFSYWKSHPPEFSKKKQLGKLPLSKSRFMKNLYWLGGEETGDFMAAYMYDEDPDIVHRAIIFLGHLKEKRYLGLIAPFLESPDPKQAERAALAMERILAHGDERISTRDIIKKYGTTISLVNHYKNWWAVNSKKYPLPEEYANRVSELPVGISVQTG